MVHGATPLGALVGSAIVGTLTDRELGLRAPVLVTGARGVQIFRQGR